MDKDEQALKKSTEGYHQLMAKVKDPEKSFSNNFYNNKTFKSSQPYRVRIARNYWIKTLSELTANERVIFLHYSIHANWQTGVVFLSGRRIEKEIKISRKTIVKSLKSLERKGFIKKLEKRARCFNYKILKIQNPIVN